MRPGGAQVIPRPETWRLGGEPAWHRLAGRRELPLAPLVEALRGRVGRVASEPPLAEPRHSAVLVALFDGERGAEVVLTRRADAMRNHRGEVSFPGGRLDPGESASAAALREAHEEVGIAPPAVELVGELDHLSTWVSASHIVPVVGHLDQRPPLRAASVEVARVFTVPLAELVRRDTYREELWSNDSRWPAEIGERPMHFFLLDDETVWGATARVLHQLLILAAEALAGP